MKRMILVGVLLGPVPDSQAAEPLDDLIAKVSSVASPGNGMNEVEQKLAEELAVHGTAAADLLIPLLKSESEDVRQLAGYCLLDLPAGALLERHLPALIEACEVEREWLPNAIADIESEEAVAFLAKEFRKDPETEAQIDHALIRTCPRSIEPLLEEFEAAGEDEEEFLNGLAHLWKEMAEKAEPAVPLLLAIAVDEKAPLHRRINAIRYLGAIGPAAEETFPKLKELATGDANPLFEAVGEAIASSRTADAAELMLPQALAAARQDGEIYLFRDIADLGREAATVGDALVELLDDPEPSVRLGACLTLGYTTRLDLWPHLVRALKDKDWRVSFAACSSLGQLKAKGAEASLDALAKSHWYPRVSHAALAARFLVQGKEPPEEISRHVGFGSGGEAFFFDFSSLDRHLQPMDEAKLGLASPSQRRLVPWGTEEDLNTGAETFMSLHPRLHKAISALPDARSWGGICRFVSLLERKDVTFVALAAGEWVGGLFAVSAGGEAGTVLKKDITALMEWNGRIVTLSGMDHMGMDEGAVHEVVLKDGKWAAAFLHALPGCPRSGGLLPDGRLVANCNGGAVAIARDGSFEYLGSGESEPGE